MTDQWDACVSKQSRGGDWLGWTRGGTGPRKRDEDWAVVRCATVVSAGLVLAGEWYAATSKASRRIAMVQGHCRGRLGHSFGYGLFWCHLKGALANGVVILGRNPDYIVEGKQNPECG